MSPPPAIELRGVCRVYPGPPPVTALQPTDFTVGEGEYVAITGASGSGKSTLLHLLGLLDVPSSGVYLLNGIDTSAIGERDRTALRGRRIGFVFQSYYLLPYRTAEENVMLAQTYNRTPRGRRREAAQEALRLVGLRHRVHSLPATMSGGERQRVAIARALVSRPTLLLCDEPTGNLDSANTAVVLDLIAELHARGGYTVLIITHDPAVAARAERVVTINDGVIHSDTARRGRGSG